MQTYRNLQIILVDDQSPDQCPKICDAYANKDPRILVVHQNHTGVSGARNTGLRYVKGNYVMFVDSDDELQLNAVELMLDDAIAHNADIVSALKEIVGNNTNSASHRDNNEAISVFRNDSSLLLSLSGDSNTNSVCAKLFKTSFIDGCTFKEGKNINEDGFFVFQCFAKHPVLVQHNTFVYQYTNRMNSNSKQRFSDKFLSMLYFCERKKELIAAYYPQYTNQAHNMEVRTNLQLLDVLCSTTKKEHNRIIRQCVKTVRKLYSFHKPINEHHKKLAWLVAHGLYPLYKFAVRIKYYR